MTTTANQIGNEFDMPLALKGRCKREYGWDDAFADKALKAYRQFMKLKVQQEDWDATILSPSLTVDEVWHQHMLDPKHYYKACQDYCTEIVGHDPDGGLNQEARMQRIYNTKLGLKFLFNGDIDDEIWKFGEDEKEEEGTNARRKRENDKEEDSTNASRKRRRQSHSIPSDDDVSFIVRTLTGKEYWFRAKKTSTVAQLKVAIQDVEGNPINNQVLIFAGRRMENGNMLNDYGVDDGSTIHLMSKLRGC